METFLEGYQSVRALSQTELEALPSFVILRQIWLLGIGAKNLPNIGLSLFESWAFDRCMPFIRAWMAEPFWCGVA
jgi:Ser/Thr protein kinase RdoA (MazF antagonist)